MLHEPAAQPGEDRSQGANSRLGVWLFLVYAIIYAGFVAINVWKPALMEKVVFMGLNLAVVYGFGLIIFALILALIYNRACHRYEEAGSGPDSKGGAE